MAIAPSDKGRQAGYRALFRAALDADAIDDIRAAEPESAAGQFALSWADSKAAGGAARSPATGAATLGGQRIDAEIA